MSTRGPTKGAELQDDPSRVWSAHPKLAALIRLVVVLSPLVVSVVFSWWIGRVAPPDEVGINRWVWLAALFLAATGVVVLFQRLFRRALPLVALMQLTLVFPDQAPSRARAALRASSGKKLIRRLQTGELAEEGLDGDMLADLLTAINDHDRLTRGHSERVRAYTEVIGDEMDLPKSEMNLLRWGALLHDVGKLTVPAEILNKDGPPNDAEWRRLQNHPTAGGAILQPLRGWLGEWIHAADEHHLHWDGGGYPGGVEGLDISLPGRMVAVADAYDVMTSARSYKKPLSHEVARKELTDCAGTQFDPAVVRVFLNAGLGRLRAAVGPLTWLVNGLSSGQAPIPAGAALSAASAAATAAVAVVVSLAAGGPSAPDTLASAAPEAVVVEDVDLSGAEDRPIEATLTAVGPSGGGRFAHGQPRHGEVTVVDVDSESEPTDDGGWGVDVRYRPDPDYHGSDHFTYTACDGERDDVSATATVTVEVASVNDAPVPTADHHTVTVGETVMVDVTTNDWDRDGDALAIRLVTAARHGRATVVDNKIEYQAPRGFIGQDVVNYSVTDPGGLSGTASLSITVLAAAVEPVSTTTTVPPVIEPAEAPPTPLPATPSPPPPAGNAAPVAVDDVGVEFVTVEDVAFTTVDVTANDSDVDDPVVPSSVTVLSSVTDGELVNHDDGTFTYTPDPDFFGVDSFTYTITDATGAVSAPATVTIVVVVVNDAPVAAGDGGAGFVTSEDVALTTADVTANDSDVDHAVVSSSVAVVSPVTSGGLVNHGDGTFTYTPDPEFSGVDSFNYTITDPAGAVSAPATVVLVVSSVNDVPVAADDGGVGFVTSEDTAFTTADVTVNDSDVDDPVVSSSVAVVSSVSDGGLVNHGDGTFTYTPDSDFFGVDSFTYTITDPAGAVSAPATVSLVVVQVNDPPVAVDDTGVGYATTEDVAFTTADVTVNDSDVDHAVDPASVSVVSSVTSGGLVNNGDGTFTYTSDPDFFGVDTFTYTITDPAGAVSAPATVTLTVTGVNDAPVAVDDTGVGFATSEDVAFTTADVTANDSDVDDSVDPASVSVVSSVADGGLINHGDGTFTYTPDPDFFGVDTFTYTITDPAVAVSAPATVSLVVVQVNDPPVAIDDTGVGYATTEDVAFTTADVTVNDSDVDHAVVSSSVAVVSPVSDGGLVNNGDGTFTYTPDPDFAGLDSFTYTVTDPAGAVSTPATVILTVTGVNDPPVAGDDSGVGYATTEDAAFTTADVTANDSDVDDPVDPASVAVVSPVSDGGLVDHGDGTFTYTPDPDFAGLDSFTYTITDPAGATSAPATVVLVVSGVNDPPVAADDGGAGFVTAEDTAFTTADVTANDSDVDHAVDPASVSVVSSVADGGLINHGDGTFTYTPDPDFFGVDSLTYTITDPAGAVSAPATVVLVVTGVNDAPVAGDDSGVGYATTEDVAFTTADVTVNDSDVDDSVDPASVSVVSSVTSGGLVDHGDGTFTYTPDPDFAGLDSFTYAITDPAGAVSVPATVVLVVSSVNDVPVAADDGGVGFVTSEDVAFTTGDVTANDSDVDHAVVSSSVAVVSPVSDGGLVNNGDGTFTYTPDPDFFGVDSFTYTITDPAGAVSAPATVTLVVTFVNDAPVAVDDTGVGYATTEDVAFTTADVTANDSDVDHAVVPSSVAVVSSVTDGGLVNHGDGTFTYTPDPDFFGVDTFTYTITDPAGATSAPATVTLAVLPVHDPPVANDDTLDVDQGAGATTIDLRLNDFNPDLGPLTIVAVTDGTNGTVVDNGDGTVTYTHDGSSTLGDSFTYTIEDVVAAQDSATVIVTVSPGEDFDGVPAGIDNCPFDFNPMQLDTDGDGIGDVCDPTPTQPSGASYADAGQDLGAGNSFEVALGDLDGDGDLDAVFANDNAPNSVWSNDGAGSFTDSAQALGNAKSVAVAVGDLDGDADLDLAFANTASEPNTIWLNDGAGAFTNSGQALGTSNSEDVAVADVDGDGDLDLSFAENGDDNTVWLNNGFGVFVDSGQSLGSGPTKGVSFADLDGDGDPDLVFSDDGADDTVWFNDGTGTFVDSGQALGIGRSHGSILLDLDGDGDVDIAYAGDNQGDTVWLNDGTGTFTDSGQVLGLGHSRAISAGDLDGDGDVDLVLGDHVGTNTVWLNDGAATFTDSTQTLGTGNTEGMALADLDGDGDLDAITANDGDSNRVWLNS